MTSHKPVSWPSSDTNLGNILIVDPDDASQKALASSLVTQGYTVHTVDTARDAWNLLTKVSLDLILLEVQLADMSGFEMCQQLKQSLRTCRIPVLFVGQGNYKSDRLQTFKVGGVDFIPKPYWVEEAVARIQLHVSQKQLQQRVQRRAQRAFSGQGNLPLLATLQRALHQQTIKLQEKNAQLQREVQERQQIEKALRQEQQKSEQLLLNILPEAIVEQLKQFQGSLAKRFDEATVLFADIVNFTPLAARLSPLELVNLLNQIFSTFDRLAEKYQLEKIKTIGDAYMVVGGVPVPRKEHVVAVADMALEMQSVMQTFEGELGEPLKLRIGINTGSVVAGVIGIRKFSYDLWGDTVNVASRMEAQGVPNKIQVTEVTYLRLKDDFIFEPAGEILIKGIGMMATYHLLRRR
ncbi:MAG: response regulator [Leptolyngbya sp. SIO1D8]|nr:response regulator [Leptolyngbya sp. SIO1D8]